MGMAVLKKKDFIYKNRKPSLSLPNPPVMVRLGAQVLSRISEYSEWMLVTKNLGFMSERPGPTAILRYEFLE